MLYVYMNNIQNSKMSKKPIYHTDGYIYSVKMWNTIRICPGKIII